MDNVCVVCIQSYTNTGRLGVLHFSIIQRWCIAPHLSKHLEEEDKT